MAGKIVVIGASADGVEALRKLFERLSPDLRIAIFVVQHIGATSQLPLVFKNYKSFRTANAVDGEAIKPGRAYLAPPDSHLLIENGRIKLSRGPRENRFPSTCSSAVRRALIGRRSSELF